MEVWFAAKVDFRELGNVVVALSSAVGLEPYEFGVIAQVEFLDVGIAQVEHFKLRVMAQIDFRYGVEVGVEVAQARSFGHIDGCDVVIPQAEPFSHVSPSGDVYGGYVAVDADCGSGGFAVEAVLDFSRA